jgi:hypothetical protein
MRKYAAAGAGVIALAALAAITVPSAAAPKPAGAKFGAPVKVTPANGFGYEPTVVADKFGNLYATAHKENWQLAVGPDGRATTATRSMSWAWWSHDNGKTWENLPTGPGDAYSHNFGDEGDMASDDAGYTYMVDTNVTDITFTAWQASGKGEVSFVHHLPLVGFAEPVDDRPWVTAHGDGTVFYFGNEGNKSHPSAGKPPLSGDGSDANGNGRYTVYKSTDHGRTWDHLGFQLKDSGWCRPAADHAKGSKYVYAVCGNDVDTVYSFVSADDGKTWKRYVIDEYAKATTDSYPTVEVAKDGSLWALHVSKGDDAATELMKVYHSKDHGRTWTKQNITPKKGQFVYAWMGVSPDGKKLGVGTYYRAAKGQPWKVYGAVWTPGTKPVLTSLDDKNPVAPASADAPPGDFLTANFTKDGKLNIVWTRVVMRLDVQDPSGEVPRTIQRDIYFARSL